MKITLTVGKVATAAAVSIKGGGEQVNEREGETATLLWTAFGLFGVARIRFRPALTPPLDISLKTKPRSAPQLKLMRRRRV